MKNKYKIIFLDCDGVINGYNWFIYLMIDIQDKFHIFNQIWLRDKLDIFGVHESKIKILSRICERIKEQGFEYKIVMSSSWRGGYFTSAISSLDMMKFRYLIKKYNMQIDDITKRIYTKDPYMDRSVEIATWITEHQDEVYSYVILDDELIRGIERRQVKTSDRLKKGFQYEGLRNRHINEVLNILFDKVDYYEFKALRRLIHDNQE